MRSQGIGSPEQHRIPQRGLPCHQRLRVLGAIKQQFRAEVFRDVVDDRIGPVDHSLGDAVGEPRQRHGQRIDDVGLRVPFGGNAIGNLRGRCQQCTARRRAYRFAIK